jgi:hypothetical protein
MKPDLMLFRQICRNLGSRMRHRLLALLCIGLFVREAGYGQSPIASVEKAKLNIVRVLITVQGLELSPSTLQPGLAQLWIENRTAIPDPQLVISTVQIVGQREETKAKAKVQALSKGRRAWNEVSLSAGTYSVSLEGAPSVQTRLIVAPKN